jgi:hypothetical protein
MKKMDGFPSKKIIMLSIFAIAMAFLEAVIVIYLRILYYPAGFVFPLNPFVDSSILQIEWLREFFTIVMLASVAIIAGKNFHQRFAYFLYSFAIWDIFYYVWLKLTLNWPASFLTWDLLFLIPIPWDGPVLAPLIVSFTMIIVAFSLLHFPEKSMELREWLLMILGAFMILITFIWNYSKLIIQNNFTSGFFNLAENQDFQKLVSEFLPSYFNWPLFIIAEAVILVSIALYLKRNKFS